MPAQVALSATATSFLRNACWDRFWFRCEGPARGPARLWRRQSGREPVATVDDRRCILWPIPAHAFPMHKAVAACHRPPDWAFRPFVHAPVAPATISIAPASERLRPRSMKVLWMLGAVHLPSAQCDSQRWRAGRLHRPGQFHLEVCADRFLFLADAHEFRRFALPETPALRAFDSAEHVLPKSIQSF